MHYWPSPIEASPPNHGCRVCRLLIVENFIPPEVRDSLKAKAEWSEDDLLWRLSKDSEASSSLSKWGGADSGVVASSSTASSTHEHLLSRRPVSLQ